MVPSRHLYNSMITSLRLPRSPSLILKISHLAVGRICWSTQLNRRQSPRNKKPLPNQDPKQFLSSARAQPQNGFKQTSPKQVQAQTGKDPWNSLKLNRKTPPKEHNCKNTQKLSQKKEKKNKAPPPVSSRSRSLGLSSGALSSSSRSPLGLQRGSYGPLRFSAVFEVKFLYKPGYQDTTIFWRPVLLEHDVCT